MSLSRRRLVGASLALPMGLSSGLSAASPAPAGRRPAPAAPAHPPDAAAPRHAGRPGGYARRADVRAWADAQTRPGAALEGWSPRAVLRALAPARYQRQAAQLMLPAPSGVAKNWTLYRARFIEPRRLQAGLRFWDLHAATLERAEARFGVPGPLILGILGVETFFGQIMGSFRVLDVLATLAFDFPRGRSDRSAFFGDELAALLLLARSESRAPASFKGSFAGAMGLGQFMPSSWRRYAIDFDGDGHIDLLDNAADAIGSVAHFLREHGWTPGQPTHRAAVEPADAALRERLLAPDLDPRWPAADVRALRAEDGPDAELDAHAPWALVRLENGAESAPRYLLGSRNFWVVTRYNRSAYYALAVLELGEELARLRQPV